MTFIFKKWPYLLGIIGLFLFSTTNLRAQNERIFGGIATDICAAPYQVSLEFNGRHGCGGSIIGPEWILTAAHCVFGNSNPGIITVHAGSTDQTNNNIGQRIQVDQIIVHPAFNGNATDGNDVALLHLVEPLCFTECVQAVPLVDPEFQMAPGLIGFITGWGDDGSGCCQDQLLGASVPLISDGEANSLLDSPSNGCRPDPNSVDRTQIAFYEREAGVAAGPGDSGGPAVAIINGVSTLIGVSSWGGCARDDFPTVYADVGAFTGWIENNAEVSLISDPIPDYVFVDGQGNTKEHFCPGETVFLDGSASENEDQFLVSIWKYEIGGFAAGESHLAYSRTVPAWQQGEVGSMINLNSIWDNFQTNEFEECYEYRVRLAVQGPCNPTGWIVKEDEVFTVEFPTPDYVFVDDQGNPKSNFCFGETVYLDGSESKGEDRYFLSIWKYEIGGLAAGQSNLAYSRTDPSWQPGEVGSMINLNAIWDNFQSDEFEACFEYRVQLAVAGPCDNGWNVKEDEVFIVEFPTPDYTFVNTIGIPTSEFCPLETVYLDGSESKGYDRYFLSIWQYELGGFAAGLPNLAYSATNPSWQPGPIGSLLNLNQIWANSQTFNFQPGFEYRVQLAVANPCAPGWHVKEDEIFTVRHRCSQITGDPNGGNASESRIAINSAELTAYPNPTTSLVNYSITLDKTDTVKEIAIMDLSGKVVEYIEVNEPSGNQIHGTHSFADDLSGIYFIRVQLDSKVITQKIMVVK